MIFKQLPTIINDLNTLGISLKALDSMNIGIVGLNAGNIQAYQSAIQGLSAEQAVFALATKGAKAAQIEEIMTTETATLAKGTYTQADIQAALAKNGLASSATILTTAQQKEIVQSGLITSEKLAEIATTLGLTTAEDGSLISKKALNVEMVKQQLESIGVVGVAQKQIFVMLGLTTAEGGAIAGTNVLTASFAKLWTVISAHPIGSIITAVGALAVSIAAATSVSNKAKEEAMQTAIELTNAYNQEKTSLDSQIEKYKELKQTLDSGNLSTNEARSIKEQLLEIQKSLIESYGNEASNIDLVNGKYKEQLGLLSELSKEKADDYVKENRAVFEDAKRELEKVHRYKIGSIFNYNPRNGMSDEQKQLYDYIKSYSELFEIVSMYDTSTLNNSDRAPTLFVNANADDAKAIIDQFYDDIETYIKDNNLQLDYDSLQIDLSKVSSDIKTDDALKEYREIYDEFMKAEIIRNDTLRPLYQQSIQAVEDYNSALSSGKDVEEAKANLNSVQQSVQNATDELEGSQDVFDGIYDGINKDAEAAYNLGQAFENDKTVQEYAEQLRGLTDIDLKAINFEDNVQSPGEDAFGTLIDILGLSEDEVQNLIDKLVELGYVQGEVQDSTPDNETDILSKVNILSQIQTLSTGLDQLSKIYADAQDMENFDWSSILNNEDFTKTFGELGSSYNNFIKQISNAPDDVKKCQDAFNALATDYVYSAKDENGNNIMSNLTEDTKDATVAMLEQIGVVNALEVVETQLGKKTSYLSDAKKVQFNICKQLSQSARAEGEAKHLLKVSSMDLENVTLEEIDALIAESNALGLDCGSLVAYRMAKFEANRESLNLNNEVSGLLAMAKAAGIATTAVASLGNAKSAYDAAMKSGNEMQAREAAVQMESAKARAEKDILNFEVPQVDLKPKDTPSSKSDSDSNSATEETKETFNFIETALTRIESAIDRVKSKAEETFRSFTSRSKSYAETISKITDEINLQEQARQKYIERRDSVGLDEYWAAQVRDGSLNIVDVTDDNLKQKIKDYEEWNDKIIECTESISDLKKDQKELVQESIELLITKYEKLAAKVSNSIESIQNKIDLKEAWGGSAGISDYRSMNKSLAKQIGYIQNQNTELKKLQKTVTNGSEAWYDYQEQIDSNNASVQNLTKSMAENAQASAALSKANADKKAKKYDSRDELNDAKIDNATTAKSKNSLINKKMSNINGRQRAYDNAVTSSTNRLNASISSINSLKSKKTNTKNKTTNKENKTYNTVLKKVKAQIKAGKRIGVNLLSDTTALNDNLALYNACVQYNANLDAKADNETIAEIYAETAKQEKADLALEKFNNIAAEYDYSTSANEQKKTELNNKISLAEAQGRKVNIAYYNGLISAETGEQQKLIQKRNALQKSLDNAVASGQIEKGSEEWYEMIDAINEVTNAIDDSVESVVEYQNAIRQIRWDTFDDSLETAKRIPGENDFYIDFMSKNKDLIDEDSRNFTEYGNAALALHNENYKNYLAQADAYAKEYNDIMDQVARGELSLDDENVIQRLRELQDAQRDAALSAEDELQANRDLVKQGYEAQLNALSELIQKYKDLQQSEKDAYEYQKSIAEKTKNISMLQKQLAAYGENDTEEARAKIQQIKVDLEEAKQDLKETEYEKYLSDTNDMLDEMYGDYEDFIDKRLKDTDAILETINASIGGMSSSIIATLASLNGGITPELEKLLNGSVSSSDYVNGVIASDKAKQEASMRAAEAQKAKEEQQKADEERKQAEEAQRKKEYETEKARRETNAKREELEKKLAIEERNLVELQNKLSDLKNDAQHELDDMNAQRAKKGLNALTSLSNISGYTKTKQEIEAKIKTAKNNIASIQKQINDLPQYANGCSYIPYDQLAWTQEKGAEAILRKSDGALLTPLRMGDMVFDNETTHRLLETSKMIPVQLVNGMNLTPMIPALPAIERNVTGGNVSIDLGGINMYGVNDPETFGRQIREEICKNGKTLQCITEGVSSKMTGKGIGSTRLFQ